MLQWLLASLHLLALGMGFGAIVARARALRGELDTGRVRRALMADNIWGLAAVLWIATGLLRAFGGFEKGTAYYLGNHLFIAKMIMLALLLVLEIRPMLMMIRWRIALAGNRQPDISAAAVSARVSYVEALLVVLMVFAATGMARGFGA